jgi:hypothetical protein
MMDLEEKKRCFLKIFANYEKYAGIIEGILKAGAMIRAEYSFKRK